MRSAILAVALAVGAAGAAPVRGAERPDAVRGGLINLSCLEALVAINQPGLAGVFSFITEKDSPAAFADLVAHQGKSLKKYVAKLDQDLKAAGGITTWDHEAIVFALALFSGPLAQTLEKPPQKLVSKMTELSLAPTLALEAVTARRKK